MKIIKNNCQRYTPDKDYYEVVHLVHMNSEIFTVGKFESYLKQFSVKEMNERYEVRFYDTKGNVYEVAFEEE